jgi:hypothetical protein
MGQTLLKAQQTFRRRLGGLSLDTLQQETCSQLHTGSSATAQDGDGFTGDPDPAGIALFSPVRNALHRVLTNRDRGRCSMFVCSTRPKENFRSLTWAQNASAESRCLANEHRPRRRLHDDASVCTSSNRSWRTRGAQLSSLRATQSQLIYFCTRQSFFVDRPCMIRQHASANNDKSRSQGTTSPSTSRSHAGVPMRPQRSID